MRSPTAALLLVTLTALPAPAAEPNAKPIVPPGAKLEHLFTRTAAISGGLTEGPAAAPDGNIYFSDIPFAEHPGMILRFDPRTKKTTVFSSDSGKSNGLAFDARGYLIACEGAKLGGRRVSRWNIKTKERETLADRYQGKKFNSPNDLCIDRQGRIYFTDPRYVGPEPRELERQSVYRIDTGGTVIEVTQDVEKPNGITLSPDQRTLYVIDHNNGSDRVDADGPKPEPGAMKVYAFPLGADGLPTGAKKTLIDFGREKGCDGMTVDTEGNIYLASRSLKRPGVLVIDPTGQELDFIPTGPENQHDEKEPKGLPSNVEFGIGEDSNVLYVTIDKSFYRIRLAARGFQHVSFAKSP